MKTATETQGNITRQTRLEAAWSQLLHEVLERGFYGTVAVEVAVQDGVIQHWKRRVERMER
jgi:hypothetical protein